LDSIADEAIELFKTSKGWELYPETEKTLNQLKLKGFNLGVLSNNDERIRNSFYSLFIELYI